MAPAPAPPRESLLWTAPSPSRRRPSQRRSPKNRPHRKAETLRRSCFTTLPFTIVVAERRLVRHAILEADQLPTHPVAISAITRIADKSVQRVRAEQLEESGRLNRVHQLNLLRARQ